MRWSRLSELSWSDKLPLPLFIMIHLRAGKPKLDILNMTIEYWKLAVAIFPSRQCVFPSELLNLPHQSPQISNTRKYWASSGGAGSAPWDFPWAQAIFHLYPSSRHNTLRIKEYFMPIITVHTALYHAVVLQQMLKYLGPYMTLSQLNSTKSVHNVSKILHPIKCIKHMKPPKKNDS